MIAQPFGSPYPQIPPPPGCAGSGGLRAIWGGEITAGRTGGIQAGDAKNQDLVDTHRGGAILRGGGGTR